MIKQELKEEAKAFDERILDRVRNGLVPDLRKAASNDWFYNNPWRRPEYVRMIFGDYLKFAVAYLPPVPARILEIGSGLGHMCLELARQGYDVTGVELSPESVDIASRYYDGLRAEDRGVGKITYINDDFMDWRPTEKFDVVCFFLTLHHFENPKEVVDRVRTFLKPSGTIIVVEPARDLFSARNAAVASLIRILLSFQNKWYENLPIPKSPEELGTYVQQVLNEYREAKEKDEKEQSPHDNSSYAHDMLVALRSSFGQLSLQYGNTLTPRMLGGVRGQSEDEVASIAAFIKVFDDYATQAGILEPGVIYFAGKLIS